MNNYQEIYDLLNSDDYYKVKKIIDVLINDSSFIKKITKEINPVVFDRFIKMCEFKIDTSEIYEKRKIFIKEIINNLNKDNAYFVFKLENKEKKELLLNRYLIEYIISYYFEDNYYNFMTNLYQMVRYLQYSKKRIIDENHIKLYNSFVELNNVSFDRKIELFKDHLNDDLKEIFYDDISKVRDDSHYELVNRTIKLNHDNEIYNKDISEKLKIDVYNLDGEAFFGFVRCLAIPKGNLFNYYREVNGEEGRLGLSFSYIGDKNIGTIDYDGTGVTLFYDDIDYKNIMYVHHADLHSKRMRVQDDYLSIKENEIITPESLIYNTKNYNEIYIKSNGEGIKPKALVCYDKIDEKDIAFARKHHLSILVINRSKYKRFHTFDEDYDDYSYTI